MSDDFNGSLPTVIGDVFPNSTSDTINKRHVFTTPGVLAPPSLPQEPPSTLDCTGRTLTVPSRINGAVNLLLDIAWSSFDADNFIRKGARISTSDGGFALIISDPQYQ